MDPGTGETPPVAACLLGLIARAAHLDDKTGMKLMNLDEAQRKFGNTATRQTRIIGDDFKPVRTVEEERDPGLRLML